MEPTTIPRKTTKIEKKKKKQKEGRERQKKARNLGGLAEEGATIGPLFGPVARREIGQILPKSSSIGQGFAKWFATRFDQSGPKGGPKVVIIGQAVSADGEMMKKVGCFKIRGWSAKRMLICGQH